jgi:hypothetical protein
MVVAAHARICAHHQASGFVASLQAVQSPDLFQEGLTLTSLKSVISRTRELSVAGVVHLLRSDLSSTSLLKMI